LLYKAAWYAWQRGRAGEAEEMSMMSMQVRSEVLGGENTETLSSMDMVGLAKALGGKYEEVETMHRQTLARSEKVLGHEHPGTLGREHEQLGACAEQPEQVRRGRGNEQTDAGAEGEST
jgi:hypothetical protein